ncbi:MAG: leucine--tRNA ligase [Phycisphaerales bacterium]
MPDDTPKFRYDATFANAIELKWQRAWDEAQAYRTPNPGEAGFDASRPKFYCLDMFPYPSGAGLHVGHPEGYTATDILCRYKRMRGFNVLHPMGYDAFGLPAEQYAIQTGVHPAITTQKSIENFRRQLKRFGFCYDWSREFATIDPDYYKWTQWVFLRLYNAWVDPRTGVARDIAELEAEMHRGVGPAMLPGGLEWARATKDQRRAFIDSYRLAYLAESTVNWCPALGTVLANDEVIDGKSERGGHPVVRKPLRQWMLRITAFAERLLNDLDLIDWPSSTKTMQAEWIGRSEGAEIEFEVRGSGRWAMGSGERQRLRVFTTRPDTIFGATYMVVAPEHPLVAAALAAPSSRTENAKLRAYVEAARSKSEVDRQADSKTKTGVDTGLDAVNPATGQSIPIWTADYVLMGYGTGAIMAVPAHDQRDFDFARAFNLPIKQVLAMPDGGPWDGEEAFTADSVAMNSASPELTIDGMTTFDAKHAVIAWLERTARGTRRINYRLRDWAFSRQRYWGEPFPIVYDEAGNHYPVSAAALPVVLPELADYSPVESDVPQPLLAKATAWVHPTAGAAGVDAALLPPDTKVRRETNTMPGSAGSSWYYLRYCDAKNGERFVSREAEGYWMVSEKASRQPGIKASSGKWAQATHHAGGIDLYMGGSEHAVGHLLYSRFWHKVLFDLGEVSTPEPFGRLFHQGMITAFAYQRPDKTLCPNDQVDEVGEGKFVERATGVALNPIVAKMSKSLKNVVNPDDVIAEYGADTFRLYEMYMGPLEASKPWNPRDIIGMHRFLQKLWRLVVDEDTGATRLAETAAPPDAGVEKRLQRAQAKVESSVESLSFNTGIAALIEFTNSCAVGGLSRGQLERLACVLSVFTPHIAEELWARAGRDASRDGFVVTQPWPPIDPKMLVDDEVEVPVQVNGKLRGRVMVPAKADPKAAEAIALADAKVIAAIEGKPIKKVIVVPGKMINFIV